MRASESARTSNLAFASAPSIPFAVSGAPTARDSLAAEASFVRKRAFPNKPGRVKSPKRLVEHLERLEFLIVDRLPIVGAAVLGRGFKGI